MRATLHDHAPNTYYGQWPAEKVLFASLESPAIAHNKFVASGRVAAFDDPERDFPGNRSPPCWKFVCRAERKICAPGEGAPFSDDCRSLLLSEATARQLEPYRFWWNRLCWERGSPEPLMVFRTASLRLAQAS
jgi:hypothetical protein